MRIILIFSSVFLFFRNYEWHHWHLFLKNYLIDLLSLKMILWFQVQFLFQYFMVWKTKKFQVRVFIFIKLRHINFLLYQDLFLQIVHFTHLFRLYLIFVKLHVLLLERNVFILLNEIFCKLIEVSPLIIDDVLRATYNIWVNLAINFRILTRSSELIQVRINPIIIKRCFHISEIRIVILPAFFIFIWP